MQKNLIKYYIDKLNDDDISKIIVSACDYNIFLSFNEGKKIAVLVKNNIDDLLNGNYSYSFNILKTIVNDDNYNNILELYLNNIKKLTT